MKPTLTPLAEFEKRVNQMEHYELTEVELHNGMVVSAKGIYNNKKQGKTYPVAWDASGRCYKYQLRLAKRGHIHDLA